MVPRSRLGADSKAAARQARLGSLFSGAGGFDLGFVLSGQFRVLFAVDILESAVATYARNFGLAVKSVRETSVFPPADPAVVRAGVEELHFRDLKEDGVDILVGGPPCQEFSIVRGPDWDRKGIQVERGRLYRRFLEAACALRPRLLVFENVPGLLSANRGAAARAVLGDFASAGWTPVFADVVNSAHFGVPQLRRRLIIIAVRKDLLTKTSADLISRRFAERLGGDPLLRRFPLTPMEAFEGRPLDELNEKYREIMREYEDLGIAPPRSIFEDYLTLNNIGAVSPAELDSALEAHRKILAELGWLGRPVAGLDLPDGSTALLKESPSVLERMRKIPPNGNHLWVKGTQWEVEGRGISLVYRRLHPLKPAYTVVAYGGGGTWGYHYERGRSKLTHRERARLQSFPDWFLFCGRSAEVRAQIGEAVPPLLGRAVAEACAEFLFDTAVST